MANPTARYGMVFNVSFAMLNTGFQPRLRPTNDGAVLDYIIPRVLTSCRRTDNGAKI